MERGGLKGKGDVSDVWERAGYSGVGFRRHWGASSGEGFQEGAANSVV